MKRTLFILCILSLFFLIGCTKNYVLTYETNGADPIESVEVKAKEVVTLVIPTNKVGHTFDGWYLEADFQTKVEEVKVTSNVTVYAKWNPIKYTVKFKDYDGSQIGSDVLVEHGKAATAPANPTREGYTFNGWDKAFNNVTSNLDVTAKYEIKKYTVKFVDHDDTQIGTTQEVEHGSAATAPTNPSREGFVFDKWDKEFSNVTENLVIKATYKVATFTVEFQDHAGTRIGEVQTIEYGKDATAPTAPTRNGYIFNKWDKEFTNVKTNLVVKATYTLISYNIKYYDGTTLIDHIPATYTIETEVILSTLERNGFIFVNWYSDEALTQAVTKIDKGSTGEVVLYGKWLDENLKHTVSYELNGGSWTWTMGTVSASDKGIDAVSNLPELFMIDFYTYLKDNNLLESSKVDVGLKKTTWADFSMSYEDPRAIYNWAANKNFGGAYSDTAGYSQFFYDSATGDANTGELLTITGGFFGTEPYKTKYAALANFLGYLMKYKAYSSPANVLWGGAQAKSATGFVLDGYFYGTQGVGDGVFKALRLVIPNTNAWYTVVNNDVTKVNKVYPVTQYVQGLEFALPHPFKDGHVFAGWYDNEGLTGTPITKINAGVTPATKYHAKWVPIA